MSQLKFDHINKIYPNGVQAVFDFDMEINDTEFVVLVGPSGCGKSTLLRMVSGLEGITSGVLTIDGVRVNEKPPVDRDIAMIFQDYALYGNMTVYENMGFSLTVRKRNSNEIFDRVMAVSDIVNLNDELNRLPKNLSGGQRQRVALGRSIVRNAKVFLMDEPLSNLDAKLRGQTRKEIILLHHRLRPTVIYVTHDQVEAMTMADRMVVMNNGRIQQIGSPLDIYLHPINLFVAGFIGSPAMNFLSGKIQNGWFVKDDIRLELTPTQKKVFAKTNEIILGFRPEHLHIRKDDSVESLHRTISVTIDYSELLGSSASLKFFKSEVQMVACVQSEDFQDIGATIDLEVDMAKAHFFNVDTEEVIRVVQ